MSRALRCAGLLLALGGCHLLFPLGGYAGPDGSVVTPGSCDGAFLCDGFESGLGAWTQTVELNGGMVEADATRAHRGMRSLHSVAQASSGESYAILRNVQAVPRHFYARVFVYQPAPTPSGTAAFIAAQESGPTFNGASLSLTNGRLAMTNWGGSTDLYEEEAAAFPTGEWVCVEWMVDAVNGETRSWRNGVEVDALHRTGLFTPPYGWFRLGLDVMVTPGVRYELWLDDLYVGTRPVGCSQ